ncbi:TPA: hypothetical protein MEH49_000241 [Klebsiella pneumoniae]|nr:hypothetical protein [Klebsiella pneumoniae]
MNPEQFIKNNVVKALLTDGYSAEQAEQGGVEAISYYRRSSKPTTKRRNIFDDCLDQARTILKYGKKKGARKKGALI